MSALTICPHYLTDYCTTTPKEFESRIIAPLIKCFKLAKANNIELVLSKELLRVHRQNFPWNLGENASWSKELALWNGYITSYLSKATIIMVDDSSPSDLLNCSHITNLTALLFTKFLEVFGQGGMHGNRHEEGVFISDTCSYPQSLESYFLLSDLDNIHIINFPWLRIYKERLPYKGDLCFIPPKNWRKFSAPVKVPYHPYGYLDDKGNSWEWDKLHNNHWDVQHSKGKGNYSNVSPEGKVLSKK